MSDVSEKTRFCRDDHPKAEPHACPFDEEVNGDSETLCRCCESCTSECADDI